MNGDLKEFFILVLNAYIDVEYAEYSAFDNESTLEDVVKRIARRNFLSEEKSKQLLQAVCNELNVEPSFHVMEDFEAKV